MQMLLSLQMLHFFLHVFDERWNLQHLYVAFQCDEECYPQPFPFHRFCIFLCSISTVRCLRICVRVLLVVQSTDHTSCIYDRIGSAFFQDFHGHTSDISSSETENGNYLNNNFYCNDLKSQFLIFVI